MFVATAGGGAVARGVEVKEGARSSEVVLVASLQKSVDGTVVGLASGRPLGGLPVALNCGESRLSSTTAADGSFRFDGAPAGLCALVVAENQPGFIVSNIPLDLSGTEARRAIGRLPLVEAAEPENSPAKSAGIGAQVRDMGGKFTVMAVRPGSAADLAGLNPVAWFARDDLLATRAAGIAGASGCAQRVASHTRLLDRTGVAVRGSAPPPDVPGRDQNEPESGGRQEHKRRRLDYLTHLYDDMGFRGVEARRRAITTYGAFLGSVQIALLGDKSLRTKAQLERQVALFEELLIPKPELG